MGHMGDVIWYSRPSINVTDLFCSLAQGLMYLGLLAGREITLETMRVTTLSGASIGALVQNYMQCPKMTLNFQYL